MARGGAAGLERWLRSPLDEDGFLRSFVLVTWWVGGAVGLLVARRKRGSAADLLCGAVAGAFAGLAGAATVGCSLGLIDALPRAALERLAAPGLSPWVAEGMWLALASAWWAAVGAAVGGLLSLWGRFGRRLLPAAVSALGRVPRDGMAMTRRAD
jgi:hypothetical protein